METKDLITEIRRLKKEKKAVILSHYYMSPEIQVLEKDGGISDYLGDSLGLSIAAQKSKAKHIIFAGVKFMAETAAILNPKTKVLLPSHKAECSLAGSINGHAMRVLKKLYPGVPIIAYINTYAETKAEADICCTSRNVKKIAQSFKTDKLIFVPDKHMGQNIAREIGHSLERQLILWHGACEVHEMFKENITNLAASYPDAEVLLHWEVPANTIEDALSHNKGIVGSTNDMINYVGKSKSNKFILASECDLGATLKSMYPDNEFITPCISCRFMKEISLMNIYNALNAIGNPEEEDYIISLDEEIKKKALIPIQRMLELS